MTRIEVLSVASELYPLVKTGGLADVAGALPGALAAEGVAVRTLLPGYPVVLRRLEGAQTLYHYGDLFGAPARLRRGRCGALELLAIDAPHLYDRPGNPYTDAHGRDWPDNAQRFAALSRVAADLGLGRCGAAAGPRPDVVHAHDWQAGLVPAYLHHARAARPATVVTVHNLAFQGLFPAGLLGALGLPPEALAYDDVEYHGRIGFLKAGLQHADAITTVSPTYAAEVCTPEAGMGLDGLLRWRAAALTGILNGIDTEVWNPCTDALVAARYTAEAPDARAANKAALQARFGLAAEPRAPLFAVVSRLTHQKGLDVLLAALPLLAAEGAQLALLGAGDAALERAFTAAAAADPARVGCVLGYDEALAHQVQAGADAILVPSRFEPCGLTQLCALRYGAVPVVARTGGLADTVIDANEAALAAGVATGVQFSPVSEAGLAWAIRRTLRLYRDAPAWRRLQKNGMAADVSWRAPARRYAQLYRGLVGRCP